MMARQHINHGGKACVLHDDFLAAGEGVAVLRHERPGRRSRRSKSNGN